MLYESHSHTPLCKHASGTPQEYAAIARQRGLTGLIVTCHNPIPGGYSANVRMSPEELPEYVRLVGEAAREVAAPGEFEILLGLESDFVPGMEGWLRELHAREDFHYILGSVHPQVPEYQSRFFTGTIAEYQRLYFTHLAEAAETGLFDSLAHPDLIKNIDPDAWDLDALMPHLCECLDRIAATGVAMELNTSGLRKVISEMNPGPLILKEIGARGIPVVIGGDAHLPEHVGLHFAQALELLREAGFKTVTRFRERKPVALEIETIFPKIKELAPA